MSQHEPSGRPTPTPRTWYRDRRAWAIGTSVLVVALVATAAVVAMRTLGEIPIAGGESPSPTLLTPSPTPSPTPTAVPTPTTTSTPSPDPTVSPTPDVSPPSEPGWVTVEIDGITSVMGIVERDGRLVATGQDADGRAALAVSDDGRSWMTVDISAFNAQFMTVVPGQAGFIGIATRFPVLMGPPEHEYLHSGDGRTWTRADQPGTCISADIVAFGSGFLGLGDRCRSEVPVEPDELAIIASSDGRSWTARVDDSVRPGAWATDGRRIVLIRFDHASGQLDLRVSDDAAGTWRAVSQPFEEGFQPGWLVVHGHGVYVAEASWIGAPGDPQPAVCVSADAERWDCDLLEAPTADLASRTWLGRHLAVTPTGFASLADFTNDPFFGGDGSTDMVMGASRDGLSWTFTPVPELKDKTPDGLAETSHGLFSWGYLNRDITPDVPVPWLAVYRAPLP